MRRRRGGSPTSATDSERASRVSLRCPRCGSAKSWRLASGRRRCRRCRFDWMPGRLPLQLTSAEWRGLLRWFVLDVPARRIAEETGLERKRVLRALTVLRTAMAAQQSSLGRAAPARGNRRDVPVIGLAVIAGTARADILPEETAREVRAALRRRGAPTAIAVSRGSPYAAAATRGRFIRLAAPGAAAPSIGELEAFWGFLRRRLQARGGVRRERLGLHLAEYAWRYNNRALPIRAQIAQLLALLRGVVTKGAKMGLSDGRRIVESAAESTR